MVMVMPFVGLIFHEVNSMTSVFIHMYPPLLLYILRWESDVVEEAWPNTFVLDYEVIFFPGGMRKTPFLESVFGSFCLERHHVAVLEVARNLEPMLFPRQIP